MFHLSKCGPRVHKLIQFAQGQLFVPMFTSGLMVVPRAAGLSFSRHPRTHVKLSSSSTTMSGRVAS